jgi:DNA-binding NarL/FixJ family response regulator
MEMPGKGGPKTIEALREYDPNLRVLVVSGYDDRKRVLAALEAGADGYIVKDEVAKSLLSSLHSVRAGHTPLSPRVASVMVKQLRKVSRPQPPEATQLARMRPTGAAT